ncbi:MAG: hypothetical protein K6G22_12605 [Lachnospiraceae bacterium]|nr:hypothetical protein [Lachnospiraceae bacterium]
MKVRIALVGELPANKKLYAKIDDLVGQIREYMTKNAKDASVELLVSPVFSGENWFSWNESHGFEVCTFNTRGNTKFDDKSSYIRNYDTSFRNVIQDEMCHKADIVIAVRHDRQDTEEGSVSDTVNTAADITWGFIQRAYDKDTPCIWISTDNKKVYCLLDSCFSEYRAKYLEIVLTPLARDELAIKEPSEIKGIRGIWQRLWENLRRNYLKRYKSENNIYPSVEDSMLEDGFKIETQSEGMDAVHKRLLEKFRAFDSAAIKLNTRFQAVLYQRSILPLWATVFVSLGFYANPILMTLGLHGISDRLYDTIVKIGDVNEYMPGMPLEEFVAINENIAVLTKWKIIAAIAAGVGFLMHACINLYAYRLSKSKIVQGWQSNFIEARQTAEILRVFLHFKPYGVELDLKKLCPDDSTLYVKLKHIDDDLEDHTLRYNTAKARYVITHLREMIEDQLSYHEASIGRYKSIVESLEKKGRILTYIGFAFVLARGLLQYALKDFGWLDIGWLDNRAGWLGSAANMFALILPSIAGYFIMKLSQNNFRYNYNNHMKMLAGLKKMFDRVEHLSEQDNIPLEALSRLSEDVAELMLNEDTADWTYQYMNSTIKPL